MGNRFPFGIPTGWFVVATSDEVHPGGVLARRYFERELAIYRTQSGQVKLVDAHCPHMGAHLGKVGSVEGDVLRCGFHGFKYDSAGTCVSTPYGSSPPAKARLSCWEVREQNGLVLTWFDPRGAPPSWEVPKLPDEGFNRARWKRYRIATHPQETTENSVDFGHFTQLHGFIDGTVTDPLHTDGHYLQSSYLAFRPYGLPGRAPLYKLSVEYRVKVWGLGYSLVHVELGLLGIMARFWVLPTPVDDEHIDLLLAASTEKRFGPLAPLIRRVTHGIFCSEVEQDLDIWTHKKFVDPPALAKGDGPVGAYRQWAKQFYATD